MPRSVWGLVVIVIALVGLFSGAGIWADYMWFASLAYQDVFWTLFLTRFTTGLVTFGIFFLFLAQRGTVFGAGYTDIHARLPVLNILMVLALIAAVAVFVGIWRGRLRPIGLGIGVLIAASILLGGIYPGLIQRFQVEPNEFSREEPYLEYSMAATRIGGPARDSPADGQGG